MSCSVHGAIEWWQAAARGSPSADAEVAVPWWTLPRASTSNTHEAHAWRESRARAVAVRAAQLILVTNIILRSKADAKPTVPEAAPLTGSSMEEQLLAVSDAAGVSGVAMNEWHAQQDWSVARGYLHGTVGRASVGQGTVGEAKKPLITSDLLQNFNISVLAWGVDLHVLLSAAYAAKLGTEPLTASDRASNGREGDDQQMIDSENDLQRSKTSVIAACDHAKQSVTTLEDLLATLAVHVQGALQEDAAADSQPDGDGSNDELIDGVTLHCVQLLAHHELPLLVAFCVCYAAQLRQGLGATKQDVSSPAAIAMSTVTDLCVAVKRVCADVAKSLRECWLVRNHACVSALGVSQRTRRILEMMSDEKQTAEIYASIAKHQRGLLTGAADRLERWASMCNAVIRTLST
jgi:hypothetical protein